MILQIINEVGIVAVIGVVVWLIRLEGVVKQHSKELKRFAQIERQTEEQEVRIRQRDEEMKALKRSLDEVKDRMEKLETKQLNMVEKLASMDSKLDILIAQKGV